jgi:hypothetical protein
MTGMAQLLIIRTQSNSNPITRAPTTIALSRRRKRGMQPGLPQTSNTRKNWTQLVNEGSSGDLNSDRAAANGGTATTTVSLLEGKLKLDLPPDFSRDADDPKDPKTLAKFSGPEGAWGAVLRGTHGLTPDKLEGYLKMRVAE